MDNVTLPLTGTGDATAIVATDEVGSAHYQYNKLAFGADGTATKVSSSDPLPVSLPAATVTTLTPPAAITGFGTAANQATIIGHLDGVEGLLGTIDADTGALAAIDFATGADIAALLTDQRSASANNTGSQVSVSTSSTTALASFATRKAATIYADPTNTDVVYIKLGATATSSNFPLDAGSSLPLNQGGAVYTGVVDAIAASGTQKINVVEW